MKIKVSEPISRSQWLRMLGAGEGDERLFAQFDEAEHLIKNSADIKGIFKIMDVDSVRIEGFSLAKHLENCRQVAVMAVTLGIGIDNLIRKTQITDISMAVIADSGASLLIEQACDAFEVEICSQIDGYTTSRFSPGYGDSPLSLQPYMLGYVDAPRKIGLNVTSNGIMTPRKSVTALIGISDVPVTGRLATCNECVLHDKCTLRKEGKYCGD